MRTTFAGTNEHPVQVIAPSLTLEQVYVAPHTPTEILALIWAEVLGVERVSVFGSFLDLGGHSLLGTQIVTRVQQALRGDLPAGQLFESPTIDALARIIRAREPAPGRVEKATQLLMRIKGMSTTDLKQSLQQKRSQ